MQDGKVETSRLRHRVAKRAAKNFVQMHSPGASARAAIGGYLDGDVLIEFHARMRALSLPLRFIAAAAQP